MLAVASVALAITVLSLLVVIWQMNRLRLRLELLEQTLVQLRGDRAAFPVDFQKMLSTGKTELISIQILNPMELASKQSKLAGVLGTLTPTLLRRIVHSEAIKITRRELERHGAKAHVRLHAAG